VPPQSNATLDQVLQATAATGGRDDWDQAAGVEPAGAGAVKWTGPAAAYYTEGIVYSDGNRIATRRLIVDTATARASGVDTDDVLVFTVAGVQRQARAVEVLIRELEEIPPELQTTRLELEQT